MGTTFLEKEFNVYKINDECIFLSRSDKVLKEYIDRKRGEIDLETIGSFCRKTIDKVLNKEDSKSTVLPVFSLSIRKNKDGYRAEAEMQHSDFPSYSDIQISFITDKAKDSVKVEVVRDGIQDYEFYGKYDALRDCKKGSKINIKRLHPEVLGVWREKGFRPMYFKGRTYMMLEGDYLPNIDESNQIDLQLVADHLRDVIEKYEDVQNRKIDLRIFKVKIEKEKNKIKVLARLENGNAKDDVFVLIYSHYGKVQASTYVESEAMTREYGSINYFVSR